MIEWFRADLSIRTNEKFLVAGLSLISRSLVADSSLNSRRDVADASLGRRDCARNFARNFALGSVMCVFANVAEHQPSGDLSGIDDDVLEDWADWHGEPGIFAQTFRKHFLTDGVITGWEERQSGLIAMQQAKSAARVAKKTRDKLATAERRASDKRATIERLSSDKSATSERQASDKRAHTNTNTNTNKEDQKLRSTSLAILPKSRQSRDLQRFSAVRDRIAAYFENVSETMASKKSQRAAQIDIAFAYWVKKHSKDEARTMLDDKRSRLIAKRLSESDGDLSEILYAIDGALKDKALTEGGYDMLETMLRDRGQIERLANQMAKYRAGEMHPMAKKLLGDEQPAARAPDGALSLTQRSNGDGILHGSETT